MQRAVSTQDYMQRNGFPTAAAALTYVGKDAFVLKAWQRYEEDGVFMDIEGGEFTAPKKLQKKRSM